MGGTGCLQHEEGSSCEPCGWFNKAPTRQTPPPESLEALLCSAHPQRPNCRVQEMAKGDGWGEGAELPSRHIQPTVQLV